VVVDFKNLTKATRNRPFRSDMVVLVKDLPERLWKFRKYTTDLGPSRPLTQWTTQQLTAFLRTIFPIHHFSAHSIKRGAVQLLMSAAAEGLIPLALVSQMAKHLGGTPTLPDTTVRYIQDRTSLARANKTGEATLLL
jgi:hypothetical protein